jgi:hypothetical protein
MRTISPGLSSCSFFRGRYHLGKQHMLVVVSLDIDGQVLDVNNSPAMLGDVPLSRAYPGLRTRAD